jgi:hypothetical protein
MTPDEAKQRAAAGLPILTARELFFALDVVRARIPENTLLWYLMNGFTRSALELAAREDSGNPGRTPHRSCFSCGALLDRERDDLYAVPEGWACKRCVKGDPAATKVRP